jgi:hypothetical protein
MKIRLSKISMFVYLISCATLHNDLLLLFSSTLSTDPFPSNSWGSDSYSKLVNANAKEKNLGPSLRMQTQMHECECAHANTRMRMRTCKYTNANAHMQMHECECRNTNAGMQMYKCKYTNANAQMQMRQSNTERKAESLRKLIRS